MGPWQGPCTDILNVTAGHLCERLATQLTSGWQKCFALNISHGMKRLKALSELRQAPAGYYEVTGSFGFTQEKRRAGGGEVSTARLRHPGQDPLQGCKGDRKLKPDPSLCWNHGHSSAHEQDPCVASGSLRGRWAGRLRLEGRPGRPLQPGGRESLHASALGQARRQHRLQPWRLWGPVQSKIGGCHGTL